MEPDFHSKLLPALQAAIPGRVTRGARLAPLARWKIGGSAAVLVDAASSAEVATVFRLMAGRREPLFLMGHASNVLFDSAGFDGVVLRIGQGMSELQIDGTRVTADAGVWVPQLARRTAQAGLSGLEHVIGIPGTLGGLVLMNGGSQRKGIGANVLAVNCVDDTGQFFSLTQEECGFAYRTSSLQARHAAVVSVELELLRGEHKAIRREMLEILASRRARFPKNLPNGGSTFLSDPAMYTSLGPPGRVIESLGLKGMRRGGAQISPQHANFIVNTGGASSDDVLWLIHLIRQSAFKETGFWMDCEVRHVSRNGSVRPAHEAAFERWNGL